MNDRRETSREIKREGKAEKARIAQEHREQLVITAIKELDAKHNDPSAQHVHRLKCFTTEHIWGKLNPYRPFSDLQTSHRWLASYSILRKTLRQMTAEGKLVRGNGWGTGPTYKLAPPIGKLPGNGELILLSSSTLCPHCGVVDMSERPGHFCKLIT